MAGQASEYHRGDMDIHEQVATFHLVMNITKWGSLIIASALLANVLWFCTGSGEPLLVKRALALACPAMAAISAPASR